MKLTSFAYAVSALAYSGLGVALFRDKAFQEGVGARAYQGAVAATAGWGWCALALAFVGWPVLALVASALDLLRYAFWFACLLCLLGSRTRSRTTIWRLSIIAGALLITQLGLSSVQLFRAPGGVLEGITFASALALPVFGLVLVEQFYSNIPEDSRWGVKPFCLALGLLFAFDVYFFSQAALFNRFDSDAVSVRGLVHALCVPLLLVTAKRKANQRNALRMSRTAAFRTISLLLVGGYLLFISAVGYYVRRFGGDWGSALQLALLFAAAAALLAMLLSGTLRAKLRVFVGKNFFSYRYDYRAEWLHFTSILSASSTPQDVGVSVIKGLADMVESPAGALWFKSPTEADFVQVATWNMPRATVREPIDSPLARFVGTRNWIVDVDEHQSAPQRYEGLTLPTWLLELASRWLVIPLQVADELTGFVVLAHARTPIEVNWEVRDLLKTAGRQAAGFLAQMHATEALLEARKFEAFNRMSAFVVHDLKNIVTQLSLMLKNAKRLHANPEFQQDMLATVENSLEKMRQLILQLREGEAPTVGYSGVDLVPIARRIAAMSSQRGRQIELRVRDAVVTRGNEARIERVLGHIVQNGLDATSSTDRVWIEVERAAGQARVIIGDTGRGMSEEFVKTRLFKPFSTTKEGGMGIGAYESFQYLKELGGSIAVDSELDRGTIVTILLPLLETQQRSDLELLDTR